MESLTARTKGMIRKRISERALKRGDKLGTLAELCGDFGVSRTILREAVAGLVSDKVVESRHGVGLFVLDEPTNRPTGSIADTIRKFDGPFMDMLELRMAFEIHAAGLAAVRRSPAQEAAIWSAVRDFEAAVQNSDQLDEKDFAFHQAIVSATNNTAFTEFFTAMGHRILPASTFSRELHPTLITDAYIEHTVREHRAICEQISAGHADGARDAMSAHLKRTHDRYRGIVFSAET